MTSPRSTVSSTATSTVSSTATSTGARHDEPSELAALLRVSATRLGRRLRQQADAGLSPTQLSALTAILRHGTMTLGALAEFERVAPPTVTKVVAKLEGDGLVQRQVDPHDRRISRISLTTEGDALLAETRRRKTAWLTGRIAELSPEDRARLANALDVLDRLTNDEPAPT